MNDSVLADDSANKSGDMYICSVCFSPDGKFLATGAEDTKIRVHLLFLFLHELCSFDLINIDLGHCEEAHPQHV